MIYFFRLVLVSVVAEDKKSAEVDKYGNTLLPLREAFWTLYADIMSNNAWLDCMQYVINGDIGTENMN